MMTLERRRPLETPVVRPVYDDEASTEIKRIYYELKSVLQVPWVGMITRAFARYPTFFTTLWNGLRELCGSEDYVLAARKLQTQLDTEVSELMPPPIAGRLRCMGYTNSDFQNIRRVFDVFSHGNNAYQPLVMAAFILLSGRELSSDYSSARRYVGRHAPRVPAQFILMEPHHVAVETLEIYDDIRITLGLPYLNSDYRALARWPSYLAQAWLDLKPVIDTSHYRNLADAYHRCSVEALLALPNPGRLTSRAIRNAARQDTSIEELRGVVDLLIYNIPPLLVNMAFLRYQLYLESDAMA